MSSRRWLGLLLAVAMAPAACTNIVPPEEAAAFQRQQERIARYAFVRDHLLHLETDVGEIYVQILPQTPNDPIIQFLQWVDDGIYNDMRFHRALHEPVPFGVQVGDPASRKAKADTKWQDLGQGSEPPVIAWEGTSLTPVPGAVLLVGRPERKELSNHLFFSLTDQWFMEDSYLVIGYIVSGAELVNRIQAGTAIEEAEFVRRDKLNATLAGSLAALPPAYAKHLAELDPERPKAR